MNPWKRLGLQIHLARDENEQKFVNSLATHTSSWLRIKFDNDEVKTDDQFQGKNRSFLLTTEILLRNDRFWRLDWETVFESQPTTRISNQFSRIILARIGFTGANKFRKRFWKLLRIALDWDNYLMSKVGRVDVWQNCIDLKLKVITGRVWITPFWVKGRHLQGSISV